MHKEWEQSVAPVFVMQKSCYHFKTETSAYMCVILDTCSVKVNLRCPLAGFPEISRIASLKQGQESLWARFAYNPHACCSLVVI